MFHGVYSVYTGGCSLIYYRTELFRPDEGPRKSALEWSVPSTTMLKLSRHGVWSLLWTEPQEQRFHLYMTRQAMRQSTLSLWIQQLAFLCLSSCTLDLVQVAVSLHLSACVRWLGTRGQVSFVKQ
ncbi:hypothetical protein CUC08_Gglean002542 [Alternaria sp. MG1]|nr:hypothetical protein CUC08_Gglean002542 [Alternaria sp. MG1]